MRSLNDLKYQYFRDRVVTPTGLTIQDLRYRYYLERISAREVYFPDGVDDFIEAPEMTLDVGDSITFSFIAPNGSWPSGLKAFISGPESSGFQLLLRVNNGNWDILGQTVSVDGVNVITGDSAPTDGLVHNVEVVVSSTTRRELAHFLSANGDSNFMTQPMFDIHIQSAQLGNRFYPVNDGWVNNPEIKNTFTDYGFPLDGYVVGDSTGDCRGSGQLFLDLSTEVDPKYGDVASDEAEAVARANEGQVPNGNFRFGDNGDWTVGLESSLDTNGLAFGPLSQLTNVLTQSNQVVAGETYYWEATLSVQGAGTKIIILGSTAFSFPESAEQQTYSGIYTATSSGNLQFRMGTGVEGLITNVVLKPVTEDVLTVNGIWNGTAFNFQESNWQEEIIIECDM